jgi:hypothetical protein
MDDVHPEFHADDEHVQGEPELGDGKQIALSVAGELFWIPGEKPSLQFREEQAKERGAQQHPGDHFRHDLGLAAPGGHYANHPTRHEDDGELEEELDGEVGIFCDRSYAELL